MDIEFQLKISMSHLAWELSKYNSFNKLTIEFWLITPQDFLEQIIPQLILKFHNHDAYLNIVSTH